MQSYELCVLFSGQKTEDEVDGHAKQIDVLLKEAKVEVKFTHSLGRKKLAYQIKGATHGEYRLWLFKSEKGAIPELNKKLEHSAFLLRHLILKLENISIDQKITSTTETKTHRQTEKEADGEEEKTATNAVDSANRAKKIEDKTTMKKTNDIAEATDDNEKEKKAKTPKEPKASLEDLDEKLDELLGSDKI